MRLRVASIIRFNLVANSSLRVRFSLPPSLAYTYSYTSTPYLLHIRISSVLVASYYRKHNLASWMGHFGTETIHSRIGCLSLSIVFNLVLYSQSHENNAAGCRCFVLRRYFTSDMFSPKHPSPPLHHEHGNTHS